MGHVWLARDEKTGLDVALKMVAREGKAGARAEREARAAAALRHPRCQRVFSLSRDTSHVYIAYEYIPGRTMREAMQAGELDDRGAVEVACQLLDALGHAHSRGIIHRDVKPANVLLAENTTIDARLLDFGLAQMAEFDTLTAVGDVPGTLAYVSPERLRGDNATAAADIWAVGVMLWESLAGRHPFRDSGTAETTRRIRSGAPPLEDMRPDLPEALRVAIGRALDLSPERRPDAKSLADELRNLPRRRKGHAAAPKSVRPSAAIDLAPAALASRAAPAALAALWTGWITATLPFYPASWPAGIAAAAAALAFLRPRAGLATALGIALFPLANISLGLALAYAFVALGWLALFWRSPKFGLAFAVGPVLATVGLLPLAPILVQTVPGRARKAYTTAMAVLVAAAVAGFRHGTLPFTDQPAPLGLGIAGSDRPGAVASAIWQFLTVHPTLITEAVVLAGAAMALPLVRRKGPWPAVFYGAALLAATTLLAPTSTVIPLVVAAWISAAALTLERLRTPSPLH